ncbi:uncharacterized protein [Rutidosis leptorrhynchoides]|uniref:uncharacterized protein n=1 Tax=Rutidosis leptorrhynchoides TaxID=125765 RepID=UPI003A99EA8E
MDYIIRKQKDIRSEYLSGLYDAIDRGDKRGSDVGSRTILPASFTDGPRYMYSHYIDALAICRVFGNPQFFITFTCNAKWPEITRYLRAYPRLTPSDRDDVVTRVFYMKVKEFIVFLKEHQPLGDFRGASTPITERLDDYISVELPDPRSDPTGYAVISATMMHGPCGAEKPRAPCMEGFACKKKFPKQYNNKTFFDTDGRAHYRRRSTGVYTTRNGVKLDNSYVVPYNRLLYMTFHAHINVECCSSTSLIKYLFKYISKGTDRVASRITKPIGSGSNTSTGTSQPVDEIQNFIDARFICPHEACWRIFKFPFHHREPAVQILAVHLENMQLIKFHEHQQLNSVIANNPTKKTTLTEWLRYNASSTLGKHLTYLEFHSEFVWYDPKKCWKRRTNLKKPSIGRISYIHPSYEEAFFLRMLLFHQRGCQSFEDIRTINKFVHGTYRLACQAAGLLGDDKEWSTALEEAPASATASQLHSLFAHILVYCMVSNPAEL